MREHRGLAHLQELLANRIPRGKSPDRRGREWFYLNSFPYQNLRTFMEPGNHSPAAVVAWNAKTFAEAAQRVRLVLDRCERDGIHIVGHASALAMSAR